MGLVDYPDSESEPDDNENDVQPAATPSKKRKLNTAVAAPANTMPPLPSSFLDSYSSTVRTSTRDDPSLHGGRKRVVPHVPGNWPTHVYLDWQPSREHSSHLSKLVAEAAAPSESIKDASAPTVKIHSLLHSDLEVPLPLHVSLSRPLALRTESKDAFFAQLKRDIGNSDVSPFSISPAGLTWHHNEKSTRCFLVLQLQRPKDDQLNSLLTVCNKIAKDFGQPLLYSGQTDADGQTPGNERVSGQATAAPGAGGGPFHASLAWALSKPSTVASDDVQIPAEVRDMAIPFNEVKVRIGQKVHVIPLHPRRSGMTSPV